MMNQTGSLQQWHPSGTILNPLGSLGKSGRFCNLKNGLRQNSNHGLKAKFRTYAAPEMISESGEVRNEAA